MAKAKTLQKREKQSKSSNIEFVRVKVPTQPFSPSEEILKHLSGKTIEDVKKDIFEIWAEDGREACLEVLQSWVRVLKIAQHADKHKIARRTLFGMFEEDANPTMKNIDLVVSAVAKEAQKLAKAT